MGIADSLKGLFRRSDTGATGSAVADPPQTTTEGAVSVPANPEGTPPAVEGTEMNMGNPNLEGSGPNSTVTPDLGETETPFASAQEIPVAEPEVPSEEKVAVKTPMSAETEEPTTTSVDKESATIPSSPNASEAESQA